MKAKDFSIGDEFQFNGRGVINRVTDVGSRSITYITLDQGDERNYAGPPYSVVEHSLGEEEFGDIERRSDPVPQSVTFYLNGDILFPEGSVISDDDKNIVCLPDGSAVKLRVQLQHSGNPGDDPFEDLTDEYAGALKISYDGKISDHSKFTIYSFPPAKKYYYIPFSENGKEEDHSFSANNDAEALEIAISKAISEKRVAFTLKNQDNKKIHHAVIGSGDTTVTLAKYFATPYTETIRGETVTIHLVTELQAIAAAKKQAAAGGFFSVYVEDEKGNVVYEGSVD